jgi:predicted MFS family arabinose efflux permease
LFIVDGATCLVAAALLWLSPVTPDAHLKPKAHGASPYRDSFFLTVWVFIVLLAVVFFQLHGTFTLYLRDFFRLREDTIGLLLGINTVLVVLLEVVVVRRLETKDPLRIVSIGALLVGLGFALLPYGRTAAWVAITIVVWTAGEIVCFALLSTWVANRSPPGAQGAYMALYVMAFGLAFVIAPLAGTRVYASLGGDWVWHGCGLIGIVLLVGFHFLAGAKARGLDPRSIPRDVHDQGAGMTG